MQCADCGAEIDEAAGAGPCLRCGAENRRSWSAKWRSVLGSLGDLREAYEMDARKLGNDDVDARVMRFFSECHDLKDWLITDMVNVPDSVRPAVLKHARDDADLETGSAIATTRTHRGRRGARAVTARIQDTHLTKDGAEVLIRYESIAKGTRYCDALALAERCVQSWREFFVAHTIEEP
jgi:hypothetical protein